MESSASNESVRDAEGLLGRVCRNVDDIDRTRCLLIAEVLEYKPDCTKPDHIGHYVLVDGLSEQDANDAMCLFGRCSELLVDLASMQATGGPYMRWVRICYSDDAYGFLNGNLLSGFLLEHPEAALVRMDAWRIYCDDRNGDRSMSHVDVRRSIATALGLPFHEHYEKATEKPLVPSLSTDESYLALVAEDVGPSDSMIPASSEALVSTAPPLVESTSTPASDAVIMEDAKIRDAVPSEVGAGVESDPSDDASTTSAVDGSTASASVGATTITDPDPHPDASPGAAVDPSSVVKADVDAGQAKPQRTRVVAKPPASGRRAFPAISGPLEKGVDVFGPTSEDVSAVVTALTDLRARVPWMSHVVDLVEEEVLFSWASGADWKRIHPLLISGPSGAGKTRFARMLSKALGLKFSSMSLAGSTDNRAIEGTTAGWNNARASWPTLMLAHMRTANPMLLVDEVEKVDSTYNGDPTRTLVSMMDPETNHEYPDVGLDCPVDLSWVSWILCCNEHRQLDVAFRDRVRIVEVRGPSAEHLPLIVEQARMDAGERMGVDPARLPDLGDLLLPKVTALFRTSKSMRAVARCVDDLIRQRVVADARKGIRLATIAEPCIYAVQAGPDVSADSPPSSDPVDAGVGVEGSSTS